MLWPERIAEILEVLAQTPCTDISFVANNVKYDNVAEYITESKGRSPKSLEIKASNPFVTIGFGPQSASLCVSSSGLLATGLCSKLNKLLRNCERRPRFLFQFLPVLITCLTLTLIMTWLLPLTPFGSYAWIPLPFSSAMLGWMFVIFYVQFWNYALIQAVPRDQKQSFMKKNRDLIIVTLGSVLLAAVLGPVATKLADRFWPSSPATSSFQTIRLLPLSATSM